MLAETCEECGSYRKVVNQEKDPMAEPLADDLASLMLDLLMGEETRFQRASANPLLYVAFAEEQDEAGDALIDRLLLLHHAGYRHTLRRSCKSGRNRSFRWFCWSCLCGGRLRLLRLVILGKRIIQRAKRHSKSGHCKCNGAERR